MTHNGSPPSPSRAGSAEPPLSAALAVLVLSGLLIGCTPKVQVEAPKEPIKIDLNITADVRIRVERAVDDAIDSNPDIF